MNTDELRNWLKGIVRMTMKEMLGLLMRNNEQKEVFQPKSDRLDHSMSSPSIYSGNLQYGSDVPTTYTLKGYIFS
jgi:hypothetical protein